jgi:hypothetical protein
VKLSLFEYGLNNGFDWTPQEQEAIAPLISMKVNGDRLRFLLKYSL